MKGKKLLATLAVSAVLFAGCGLKSGQTIIKVNDQKITQAQYDAAFDKQAGNSMFAQMGIDVKNDKNTFLHMLIKDRVINELIVRSLLDQELAKRGIKVTKDDVDNAVKEVIDKVGSKEQLDKLLKQNGMTAADFRKDLTEEVKMKKLANELGSSNVSDLEAKTFYNKNIDKFKYPERVRASHILISANPKEIEEVIVSDAANKNLTAEQVKAKVNEQMQAKKVKADQLLAEAKKDTKQFAKLAKENSDDTTSATKGGDLGFFAKQEMVPEFANAAFALRPNSVSAVVKSPFGYHIIFVTDRMAAGQEPFEKVKGEIKQYLQNQKQLEQIDKLTESLKKNANIEYVNPEFDPAKIQKGIQQQMKDEAAAEKAKEPAKK